MERAPERLFTAPLLLCFAANTLQGLAFNLFLHLPGYLKELGAGEARIGFITSLTAVAAIALRPPIGRMMDRRGRRPVILLGSLLNVFVVGFYTGVDSLGPLLYVVRVGHGLAEAMLFSSLFTFAADCVPADRRTQGLALFGVSGILPISLGASLGDQLLALGGYRELFLSALGFAGASLLVALPLRDPPRQSDADEAPRGLWAALVQRDLVPLWFLGTVFSVAITAFWIFIKTFVDETGIGSVSLFFNAYTAAALVLRVFLGWLPDRVGPKRVLGPAMLSLAAGFAVLAWASADRDVAVAGVLCGIGHGFTFPILFGLVVSRAPDPDRGAAMAIFTALFDLGVLLGGPGFGWVVERASYPAMFAAGVAIAACGTAVFFVWDRAVERAARRTP